MSPTGRLFSNYLPALDPTSQAYAVAELFANNTEQPFPNGTINSPPGGRIENSIYPPMSPESAEYLIGVQSVVADPADHFWIPDT